MLTNTQQINTEKNVFYLSFKSGFFSTRFLVIFSEKKVQNRINGSNDMLQDTRPILHFAVVIRIIIANLFVICSYGVSHTVNKESNEKKSTTQMERSGNASSYPQSGDVTKDSNFRIMRNLHIYHT